MLESKIQAKKIKQLEEQGYYVIKLLVTNKPGIPDLIAIPPNAEILFVEVKKPDGKLSKLQEFRKKELESHGIRVEVFKGN
jgi:Holliday junction resolvase-like predicted endonuclease